MERIFVGISGASGHAYARTLVRALLALDLGVDLSVTPAGAKVLRHEEGVESDAQHVLPAHELERWLGPGAAERVRCYAPEAIEAPPSSGTALRRGAILCPCSMGTLARVAVGFSSNLVERAADVALKEGRPLCLVPRETPLSAVHLENMLRLARLGAAIVPAAPGFYHRPDSIQDLLDHVVGKVLDRMGLAHGVGQRWSGLPEAPDEPGTGAPPPADPLAAEEVAG